MDNSSKGPILIEGGFVIDDRGMLVFANDFDFRDVKRFYLVENFSPDVIRAFHGHKKEAKYIFVAAGSALVAAVIMDHEETPSKTNKVHRFVLSDRKPTILYIPAGFANGFRALEAGTRLIFFSTATLEESKNDDFRFPHDYWGEEVWKIENR